MKSSYLNWLKITVLIHRKKETLQSAIFRLHNSGANFGIFHKIAVTADPRSYQKEENENGRESPAADAHGL